MRVLRFLVRFLGWLLTPLVAWAASFIGAWVVSLVVTRMDNANQALVLTLAGGAVAAVTVTFLWMRLLRRSPELQEILQVTAEGVPIAAIEEESSGPGEAPSEPKGTEG